MTQPDDRGGLPRPGMSEQKRATHSARQGPRVELTIIAVAIVLPIAIVAWRFLTDGAGSEAVIAFEWPEHRRPGTALQLDGAEQEVTPTGPLEYCCRPGEIRVVVTPQGGPPFLRSVVAEAGQKTIVQIPWHEFDLTGRWPTGGVPQGDVKARPGPEHAAKDARPRDAAPDGGVPSVAKTVAEGPRARPPGKAASPAAGGGIVFPTADPNFSRVLGPVAVGRWQRWAARTRSIQERSVASEDQSPSQADTPAGQIDPPSPTSPGESSPPVR
jgi:hypothetical protein